MIKRMVIVCLLTLSAGGCASEKACLKKISILEAEMSDLRQQQQQTARKLEELQIQLSVLSRRLSPQPVAGAAKAAEPKEAAAKQMAADDDLDENQIAELLQRSLERARKGRSPQGLKDLDDFLVRFGDHPLAAQALMERGRSFLSYGEVARALADFTALAAGFPDHSLAAEALLLAGNCSEKQGDVAGAKNYYLQLVQTFPLSAQAAQANKRLEAIR